MGCRGFIAIIDDDPMVRSSVHRLAASLSLRAEQFSSPREFLESDFVSDVSCVISDVNMPEGDAEQFLAQVAVRGMPLPIIFMTARPNQNICERLLAAGAVSVLTKPFDQSDMVRSIAQALWPRPELSRCLTRFGV